MKFLEILLISIVFFSFLGILIILFRKIPALVKLPEKKDVSKESLSSKLKKFISKIPGSQKFDYELYLQKMLSKVRVLTFRLEGKTGNWLERLRQKRNGHNGDNHDSSYWEELKKAKEGK